VKGIAAAALPGSSSYLFIEERRTESHLDSIKGSRTDKREIASQDSFRK